MLIKNVVHTNVVVVVCEFRYDFDLSKFAYEFNGQDNELTCISINFNTLKFDCAAIQHSVK